jgi:quercetin dioxygenase-like cupin family protein
MKIFRFGFDVSKPMEKYQSKSIGYSMIVQTIEPSTIGYIYIEPGGVVGYHEAPIPQFFLVVQGQGWVRGEKSNRTIVSAGDAVYWEKGEGHESGSELGMSVIIIQSDKLNPNSFIQSETTE